MWIKRWHSLSVPQRVASVASAAAVAVWTAVLIVPDVHEALPATTEPAPVTERAVQPKLLTPSAPAPVPPRAAQPAQVASPAPATDPLAALRAGLSSDNAGTRIEAVRKLAAQDALPELLALDVARDPELAPTLIQVTGQLAQQAQAPQRGAAVAQLTRWLKAESARAGVDARGNVSVLVETLGAMASPDAESALIDVLHNDQLPLHIQTVAVEGLARLASPAAQAALTQFRTQLGQSGERQGFELELQREAEHATDRALARLSR